MPPSSDLRPPQPVLTAHLFPELLDGLLDLLAGLQPDDWDRPTACRGWTVKDVALHLLGGEIGNLSRRRDGFELSASIEEDAGLVALVNRWNESWVEAARRISPQILIDLLDHVGRQMAAYFGSLEPFALGGPVSWAGPEPAPVWLDVAREYTERWHHQQHIRDAVRQPGFCQPRYLGPALAAFMRALPVALEPALPPEGTRLTVSLTGEAGSAWTAGFEQGNWRLYEGFARQAEARVSLDQDLAWRLFTRGVSAGQAREAAVIEGDPALAGRVFEMVSIIA